MAEKKANHANEKLAYEIRRHMYDTKNAETRFMKHGLVQLAKKDAEELIAQ